jgi:hypothetical protein
VLAEARKKDFTVVLDGESPEHIRLPGRQVDGMMSDYPGPLDLAQKKDGERASAQPSKREARRTGRRKLPPRIWRRLLSEGPHAIRFRDRP